MSSPSDHGPSDEQEGTPDSIDALRGLLRLKSVARAGWKRHDIPPEKVESVADHSYGLALLAWVLCPPELDLRKVLELALLHDLAEIVTGDITPHQKVPQDEKKQAEEAALKALTEGLSKALQSVELLREYQEQTTDEARFVKAVDKLEMSLQSLNYQQDYGMDLSEFRRSSLPYLQHLGSVVKEAVAFEFLNFEVEKLPRGEIES